MFQNVQPKSGAPEIAGPSAPPRAPPSPSMGVLALPLVVGVVALLVSILAAIRTWKRGHKLLFAIGFFAPIAWIIGCFLRPPKQGEWI